MEDVNTLRNSEDVENFADAILSVIDDEQLSVGASIDDILALLSVMSP